MLSLEAEVTERHAEAVEPVPADTIRRGSRSLVFTGTLEAFAERSFTWQIGDASRLAESTGLPVVADFRRRDMAAGGQGPGRPTPLFHAMLWADDPKPLAVLNLGDVGSLGRGMSADGHILAGDTGPGCGLLDIWAHRVSGQDCDVDGGLALCGTADEEVVARALRLPFFARPFPKSADRSAFRELDVTHLSPQDGAATLCAVTVRAVRQSAAQFGELPPGLWVTGGGVRHPVLMRMLSEHFPNVQDATAQGLRDWLGSRVLCLAGRTPSARSAHSLPTTTGCRQATCGGVVTVACGLAEPIDA